jgi:4-amino-4-deoxy-L-arabinose transferase-like glycosyltransferase
MFTKLFLPHPHRLTWPAYALLLLFGLVCFLPGFSSIPPFDRDESRFAQASKQMMESGDLVDIHFQDDTRHKKPIGIYWLQASAVRAFETLTGNDLQTAIWAYRIPSLLGALLSVLFTAMIGARLFNAKVGLAAGALMAACLILNVEARMAKTDAMLLASILACQMVLAKAFVRAGFAGALKIRDVLVFWVGLSIGILIKGPIILLPVLGTLIGLKIMKEPLGWLKHLRPLLGTLIVLALVLPWFILITLKTNGAFYNESAGYDLLDKIWHGQNWGGAPPGFYLITVWGIFWPGSLPLALALPWLWKNCREPVLRFLFAWIIPGWLVFELTMTKLVHYTLPFYPALAVLAAAWLFSEKRELGKRWLWAVSIIWGGVTLGLALAPLALPIVLEHTLEIGQMFFASLMLAGGLAAVILFHHPQKEEGLEMPLLAAGGVAMTAALFGFMLPNLPHLFMSSQVAMHLAPSQRCAKMEVVTAGYNEPSLVFLAGTRTRFLEDGAAVAEAMAAQPCLAGVVDKEQLERFTIAAGIKKLKVDDAAVIGFNYGRGKPAELHVFRSK